MSKNALPPEQKRAIELIRSSKRVYIGTHIRPDGDALGSMLGLALALEECGKRTAALCAFPAPDSYRFLPAHERVSSRPPDWPADLGIVVDCDGISRLGDLQEAFAGLPHLIDIDHHSTDQSFGEVSLVHPSAAATAEIVYTLLCRLGAAIDADIATCLYTGILADTGRFSHANTSAASLAIAAKLVRAGARPHHVARKLYEERSLEATHLLGLALSRLSRDHDGEVVSAILTRADFVETGADGADTEGIIDHLRAIGGPQIALLLVETEDDCVRVSLRSDGRVDVSAIAYAFGGGGHAGAAGCTLPGNARAAKSAMLAEIRKRLSEPLPDDAA